MENNTRLEHLPCLDSEPLAAARQRELEIHWNVAAKLGHSAVRATKDGWYFSASGRWVEWRDAVEAACVRKRSIPAGAELPGRAGDTFPETRIQVSNETTLGAARRLVDQGLRPLALNFANGVGPGGGFLHGARAQEEVLCRSSALYPTLLGDAMYAAHGRRPEPDSTDWAIVSPDVPVFRNDDGTALDEPWPLSVVTCAAPYAPALGEARSADLLRRRIHRVLAIARAHGYQALVLGAWGCGAFHNDPGRTAADFRDALESAFAGAFSDVVFAIADWSPERRFLGPFRDTFAPATAGEIQ